jgi:VWFA-related protein
MTLAIAAVVWGGLCAVQARQQTDTPPAGTVLVDVLAERADGSIALSLGQQDFEVKCDGAPCPVVWFSGSDRPVSLVVLLDASDSFTALHGAESVKQAVEDILIPALKQGDRARIGNIARQPFLSASFTSDPKALKDAVATALSPSKVDRFGPSPIWDAVDAAVGALEHEPGRRAILLVTDGRATGNRLGLRDVIDHANAANVTIDAIGDEGQTELLQADKTVVRGGPGRALALLSGDTGGLYQRDADTGVLVPAQSGASGNVPSGTLLQTIDRVMTRLHHMSALAFTPPARDGHQHTIEIRTTGAPMTVFARKSYRAVPPGDSR